MTEGHGYCWRKIRKKYEKLLKKLVKREHVVIENKKKG